MNATRNAAAASGGQRMYVAPPGTRPSRCLAQAGLAALIFGVALFCAVAYGFTGLTQALAVVRDTAALGDARGAERTALADAEASFDQFRATNNGLFLDVYARSRRRFADSERAIAAIPAATRPADRLTAARAAAAHRAVSAMAAVSAPGTPAARRIAGAHAAGAVAAFRALDAPFAARIAARRVAALTASERIANAAHWAAAIAIAATAALAGYVTLLLRMSARIEGEAARDPLTQLANRRSFESHIRVLAGTAANTGERIGIIFLDFDDFKQINDTYGHQSGDAVLRAAGNRLAAAVGTSDVVARLGGDEFAIGFRLDADATPDARVSCVREIFRAPFALDAETAIVASCSIGVTVATAAVSVEELLGLADRHMYADKNRDRLATARFDSLAPDSLAS